MTSLSMNGSYPLDAATVDLQVRRTSPGNYALGHLDSLNRFRVEYVGRSDSDVNGRLKQHLAEGYHLFKFSYATSPKAAFEKECQNFHDFQRGLQNNIHPQRPMGANWFCPYCDTHP